MVFDFVKIQKLAPGRRFLVAGLLAALAGAPALAKSKKDVDFEFDHVSCGRSASEIRIVVTDVDDSVGLIAVDLYRNEQEGFLKGAAGGGRIVQRKFAARAPQTRFCLPAPEAGNFAIAIYHDENANGKFDKGAFGIPAEPWGMSQNPKPVFRAPTVDEALFTVDETGAKLAIELN